MGKGTEAGMGSHLDAARGALAEIRRLRADAEREYFRDARLDHALAREIYYASLRLEMSIEEILRLLEVRRGPGHAP